MLIEIVIVYFTEHIIEDNKTNTGKTPVLIDTSPGNVITEPR